MIEVKYLFIVLLVSFLFLAACSSNDVLDDVNLEEEDPADDLLIDDEPFDDDLGDEDILPELVDGDDYIEIGDMI